MAAIAARSNLNPDVAGHVVARSPVFALVAIAIVMIAAGCAPSPGGSDDQVQASATAGPPVVRVGEWNMQDKVEKTEAEWKQQLTPEQFQVLRRHGTERAFTGAYHDSHESGVYRCAGCGLELFSSETKFDSGTGWPSYYQPINPEHVGTKEDNTMFSRRTEVHCARCGGHLGHVFDDGPDPTGLRYCINSVSLAFDPGTSRAGAANREK
jgi:peptide-methionine (R)-S-oxide reductase